jgi:hypothetical protein
LKRWLTHWLKIPKGHIHEQKKRPNTSVPTIIMMERASPLYTVRLVRNVVMEMSGSISRNRETSYPFIFRKSVMLIRKTKRQKKNTE